MNPVLVLVCGLPGSGKSFFANHLSKKISAVYFNTDVLRKELFPINRTYSEEEKQFVYDTLLLKTEENLKEGKSAIVDATFYKNDLRIPFYTLAQQQHISLFIFYIEAEEKLIKERTSISRIDSEADYSVYLKLKELFEPIDKPFATFTSTQTNINSLLSSALTYMNDGTKRD